MKLRIISAKFVAILLAVCAIISAIPFAATAEENETLEVPATLEWITVNNGRVEVFCADSNGDPIKAPNWLYYSILCEYEIYFNGKTEDDLLMTVDGDPYYADITATLSDFGEGTYYFRARVIEYEDSSDLATGNVSPWSGFSDALEYRRPDKVITDLDLEISRKDCYISGGKYIDLTDEKGYDLKIETDPCYTGRSELLYNGYPYLAYISVLLPYGESCFSQEIIPNVTVNGRKADGILGFSDLKAILVYRFDHVTSEPYVKIGTEGNSVDLTKDLGKEISVGGGTAKLTQKGDGYVLELTDVTLNGGTDKWTLTSLEWDNELGKYVNEVIDRTFGIRANRDVELVLNGVNAISDENGGVYYGIAMEEASSLTVRGDGTLNIYAGGIAENGWGSSGYGHGILTSDAFCSVTVESGNINIRPLVKAYGISAAEITQKGGELTVIGNDYNAAVSLTAFGALRLYGGKMTVSSEQSPLNSGAIETEGSPIYVTGGELTATCTSPSTSNGRAVYYNPVTTASDQAAFLNFIGGKVTLIGQGAAMEVDSFSFDPSETVIKVGSSVDISGGLSDWTQSEDINNNKNIRAVVLEASDKKVIEQVEIENAITSYKEGDSPEFTAKVSDRYSDIYEITGEMWFGTDGSSFIEGAETGIFGSNAEYSYYLGVNLTENGENSGYVFADNVKLILNGEECIFDMPYSKITYTYGCLFCQIVTFVTDGDTVWGDANGDGTVDIEDAMLVFYHVAKKSALSDDRLPICDTNADGEVDIEDAMTIFYFVAKKIDKIR